MRSFATISLRQACARDASAIEAILHDTYGSTWLPQLTGEAAQVWKAQNQPATYVAARGLGFWVAEVGGKVVGFVDWDKDFVNALHVFSTNVRMGVGNCLMDKAEAAIAGAGFAQVRLETDTFNTGSRAFYNRRGYREADRYPDREWNSGFTTLLLVKSLR